MLKSKSNFFILLLMCGLLMLNACGSSNRVQGSKLKKKSLKFVEDQVERNLFDADWLRMKARITASDGRQKQSFNADIRLRKDSVLWMSISPTIMKIEVARILVRPDSVQVINRINKQYYASDVDALESLTKYPLDFAMLQNILFGNPVMKGDGTSSLSITKEHYCIENTLQDLDLGLCLESNSFNIAEMSVRDTLQQRTLNMLLTNYEDIDKQRFSLERVLNIQTPQEYNVEIKLSKIKVNEPQKTSFSVSPKYKKVDRLEIN